MMNRFTALVAVIGLSLGGAACQNSGGFSADADTDFRSTNTASSTDFRSSDKTHIHNNNIRSSDVDSTVRSESQMNQPKLGNDSMNSSGTADDR